MTARKKYPRLSPGAKVRATYQASAWRAKALSPVGTEYGFLNELARAEYLELAELLARAGAHAGTRDDGRALRVLDAVQANGWTVRKACVWVLAQIDAEASGTAPDETGIAPSRIHALVKRVKAIQSDPTVVRSQLRDFKPKRGKAGAA